MLLGNPHFVNSESRMLMTDVVLIELVAVISGHLLCKSCTTTRNRWLCGAAATSPKMSTCNASHGCWGQGVGYSGAGRGFPAFSLMVQLSQCLTCCSTRLSMPGHQMHSLHFCFIFTMPGWPAYASSNTRCCNDAGITARVPRASAYSSNTASSSRMR